VVLTSRKNAWKKIFIFPLGYYANCVSTTLTVLILHNVESVYFFYSNLVYQSIQCNTLIWIAQCQLSYCWYQVTCWLNAYTIHSSSQHSTATARQSIELPGSVTPVAKTFLCSEHILCTPLKFPPKPF